MPVRIRDAAHLLAAANQLVKTGKGFNALHLVAQCDKAFRNDIKAYYKHNAIAFINHCVVAVDESQRGQKLRRFILYPEQERLIREIEEFFNTRNPDEKLIYVIKKSRRVGMTNTILWFMLHRLIFWNDSSGLSCLTLTKVDEIGNPSSLMERLRSAIKFVPYYLLPESFNPDRDCPQKLIRIGDGATSAAISGHPINDPNAANEFLKSGRYSIALIDEAAALDSLSLDLALTACRASTDLTVVLSTAATSASHSFERMSDETSDYFADKNIIRIRWFPHSINPDNTDTWVNSFRTDEETFEREIMGNPFGVSNVVIKNPDHNIITNVKTLKPWALTDSFISKQLTNAKVYLFADGGGNSNFHTLTVALKPKENDRLILVNSFASQPPREEFMPVAERALSWVRDNLSQYEVHKDVHCDPVLASEALEFQAKYGLRLVCMEHLQHPSKHYSDKTQQFFKSLFATSGRLTHRLARLRWYMQLKLADNHPALIILPECKNIIKGLIGGDYQFEVKHKVITSDLLQNHPICDECDGLTYGVISLYPLSKITTTTQTGKHGIF
jgi:hypothetical protein